MDKDQFVNVDSPGWWFLEVELDPTLEQKRKTLGECWEWTDLRWFTERQKMEEVYRFLELNQSDLLRQLDEATDLYRRQQWLDDLIKAKRPTEEKATVQGTAPAPEKPGSPTWKRAEPTGKPADVAAGAPRKPSPFARTRTTAESQTAPTAGTPATAGAPAAPPGAEPRKPSAFGRKAAARAQAAPPAPATSPAQAAAGPGGQVEGISEQIKTVMEELSADELSSIARDLGVTADEVEAMIQEPDFARMVAEEQAHLGTERP